MPLMCNPLSVLAGCPGFISKAGRLPRAMLTVTDKNVGLLLDQADDEGSATSTIFKA